MERPSLSSQMKQETNTPLTRQMKQSLLTTDGSSFIINMVSVTGEKGQR